MNNIKCRLSECLNVSKNSLNEIEIEDIEFASFAQQNINKTVSQMLSLNNSRLLDYNLYNIDCIPCKSYWVEKTQDLVLFISIGTHSRTIIVPKDGWMLRNDIIIN